MAFSKTTSFAPVQSDVSGQTGTVDSMIPEKQKKVLKLKLV